MREEWLNRIALTWANKTRHRQVRALLDQYNSATTVLTHFGELVNQEAIQHAQQEWEFIEKHHINLYFYKDDNYPYRLANCVDAPLVLYSKGNVNMNAKHMLSIVGTRMPSERGKDWCRRFVLDLAAQVPDLTIVSGLAYGIDVVAHRAAIEAGIPTIIVPAHGLDRIYPAVHRNVAIQALNQGGIVTEYTCGTEPERFNFVARNRIVAGLADAVVIVESKRKGGYNVVKIDPDYVPEVIEHKHVFGITFEQGRNNFKIDAELLKNIVTENKDMPESAVRDLIVALITLKYTQSNSVCYAKDGQAIGVGAGQQSRIHCTRLAGTKADTWFLRQHEKVLNLPFKPELGRPDRDNVIDGYINKNEEDVCADGNWQKYFTEQPAPLTDEEAKAFLATREGVALGSDAFFPFSDNIERAKRSGVKYIAEPGGSIRDDAVIDCCNKYDMVMAFTGMRLFHH